MCLFRTETSRLDHYYLYCVDRPSMSPGPVGERVSPESVKDSDKKRL